MNINVNSFRNYMFIYATRLCCLDIKTNDIMHALRWTVFESNNFNYVGKKTTTRMYFNGKYSSGFQAQIIP